MKDIVRKNVKLMESSGREGMLNFLASESIGGNAQSFKGYPCVAINFFHSKVSGEIIKFGNYQNIDPTIRQNENYLESSFLIALKLPLPKNNFQSGYNIIKLFNNKKITPNALATLKECIKLFNQIHGFPIKA